MANIDRHSRSLYVIQLREQERKLWEKGMPKTVMVISVHDDGISNGDKSIGRHIFGKLGHKRGSILLV